MIKKVSVMLDEDVMIKLRDKQAELVNKFQKSISLSRIVNDTLHSYFK